MSRPLERFVSLVALFLAACLGVALLHAGTRIAQQGYLGIGYNRTALAIARAEIDGAAIIAVVLACAAFASLSWILPGMRDLLARLPPWLARAIAVALLVGVAGRVAWSVERLEYYRRISRALTPPLAVILALALAAVTILAAVRISRSPPPIRWTAVFPALFAIGALCLEGALAAAGAGSDRERPNVILVSLDTVRADHVGCYGYARRTTPGLDLLARESTLFETAVTAAPWTLPSHASIFTSLYPHHHGATGARSVLAPGQVTLAEVLGESGYATAAFTGGAYLSSRFGLSQGFEIYRAFDATPTSTIVDAAIRWLDRRPARKPYFLFVHTYEPHTPYLSNTFANAADGGRIGGTFTEEDLEALRGGRMNPTPAERRYITDLYDGDLLSTDAALTRLWEWLREKGELDRSIVVVTSDHGEELFERSVRRSAGHGHSLYEEIVRVPLIVRFPPRFASGRRVEEPVSLVDIAPTIAGLTGIRWPSISDGLDLTPPGPESARGSREGVLSESLRWGQDRRSYRTARYKYIAFPGSAGSPPELYDLAADPGERRNLSTEIPAISARLASRIRRYPAIVDRNTDAEIDQALERQLHALGYVR